MKLALVAAMCLCLSACATYRQTLVDEKGRTITCEAAGKNGFITGLYLRRAFEQCIADAHSKGFD